MWALFKDKNEINEKNIIGFASFIVITLFAVAKATAPPEPPSPVIREIIGIRAFKEVFIQLAIASACPLSSAPLPGYAPAVSMNIKTGKENLSANFINL